MSLIGDNSPNFLWGTKWADTIKGLGGNDWLVGDDGNDSIFGGTGNDLIHAGEGDDYVEGGDDDDEIYGHNGEDTLDGGEGDDEIYGEGDDDLLWGGIGQDTLDGGAGQDLIFGQAGNDLILGSKGADWINGGDGYDIVDYTKAGSKGGVALSLEFGVGYAGEADGDQFFHIEEVIGTSWGDILLGAAFDTTLRGGKGADILAGSYTHATNDKFYGGEGNDTMNGWGGDDYFAPGSNHNTVNGGAGTDTLDLAYDGLGEWFVNLDWGAVIHWDETLENPETMSKHTVEFTSIENVTLGKAGGVAIGDDADNVLTSFGGGRLEGATGNDTLINHDGFAEMDGGEDDDILTSAGFSTAELTGASGADTFDFRDMDRDQQGYAGRIMDFSRAEGDKIQLAYEHEDLANALPLGAEFAGDFKPSARLVQEGEITQVQMDSTGDGQMNWFIEVAFDGPPLTLVDSDFIL